MANLARMHRRGGLTGGEKDTLTDSLDRHREALLWKLDGLSDEQLRQAVLPSGYGLLGLVKHVAWTEYGWFVTTFGRPAPQEPTEPGADFRVGPGESAADVFAFYAAARAVADAVIGELELTDRGRAWWDEDVTLRWVLVHMIEETCRHIGHADVIRELIDGATGAYPARF
jgi:hypothetical protein